MYSQSRLLSLCLALTSASLLLMSESALADSANTLSYKGEFTSSAPAVQMKVLNDGLYAGVAGGYDSYRMRVNTTLNFNGDTITANPMVNPTGFVGGVFLGFGQYFRDFFYLGAEAFANISGASANYSFTDSVANSILSTRISVGTNYGLGLLPGIKINDSSLFYLRVGLSYANIEGKQSFSRAGLSGSTDNNNWGSGLAVGLGLESVIYRAFSLRGEFTHTEYKTFNALVGSTTFAPADNQFMLGLIYHL